MRAVLAAGGSGSPLTRTPSTRTTSQLPLELLRQSVLPLKRMSMLSLPAPLTLFAAAGSVTSTAFSVAGTIPDPMPEDLQVPGTPDEENAMEDESPTG